MTARSRPEDIEYILRLKFGSQFSYSPAYNLKPLLAWSEQELTAAEAFQAIFNRAQLRERYAVPSSLIDRVDGGGSRSDEASASMYEARERVMEALTVLGGSMGPVVWDVI